MEKLDTIAIAVTVRADQKIIESFINYHISRKFDEVLIFLDDPDFNNIPDHYHNHDSVKFILCDDEYWKNNTIRLDKSEINKRPLAIEHRQLSNYLYANQTTNCDWLANIDIDELIYSPYHLNKLLSLLPLNLFSIRMKPSEAIYNNSNATDIFDTQYFKVSNPKNNKLASTFYNQHLGANNGFWGHRLGKILARTSEVIKYINNHDLSPLNDTLTTNISFNFLQLLHFEGMSKKHFIEKQTRRFTKAVVVKKLSGREYNRLDIFKKTYENNGENGLAELYEHMHVFSDDRLKSALDLGFIKKIEFRLPLKEYKIGLEDFHFKKLYYSLNHEKVFASSSSDDPKLLVLNFVVNEKEKAIFFIQKNDGALKPLVTDGHNFYITPSKVFKLINVLRTDDFYTFINDNLYLIALKNGNINFNSDNLGDWELFELKSI